MNKMAAIPLFAAGLILGAPIWGAYFAAYSLARALVTPVQDMNRLLERAYDLWVRP